MLNTEEAYDLMGSVETYMTPPESRVYRIVKSSDNIEVIPEQNEVPKTTALEVSMTISPH